MVEASALNNSLPTYFLVLRGVIGDSNENIEFRTRAISALAGGLTIPVFIGVIFLWRRRWGAALVAGLLLATNPLHIWYSQEVRAYALMLFFGLLTLLGYELARQQPKSGWWAGYVLSALVAIALHKTALVFPVACALWHGWAIFRERGRWRNLLIHPAVLAVALLFLMPRSHPPPQEFGRASSVLEIGYTFMTYMGGYSFGPSLTDIQSYGALAAVARHPVQVGILCAVLLLIGGGCWCSFSTPIPKLGAPASLPARLSPATPPARMPALPVKELSLLLMAVGTVAAGALLSAFPYNIRYTLPGLLAFLALEAGLATARSGSWFPRAAIAGVLLTGLWADGQWFFDADYRKGDSRAVADWLVKNESQVKSWTVLPDYLGDSIKWYLQGHPEVSVRLQPAKQANSTSFPPVPDVLIIGRRHHVLQPDQLIASYQALAGKTGVVRSFAGFELYVKGRPTE
jgi:hypothetical protein